VSVKLEPPHTLGSPLKGDVSKPSAVTGDWIDIYSNYDPVTWLNAHPSLTPATALWDKTWEESAIRVNADARHDMTGKMKLTEPGHFLLGLVLEHVHYWVNKQFVIPIIVAGIR